MQHVPEIYRDFSVIYPDYIDWTNSTAAARVNGYVGGNGTQAELQSVIDDLGLSSAGSNRLLGLGNSLPVE